MFSNEILFFFFFFLQKGHGKSDWLPSGYFYTPIEYPADVLAVVDNLGWSDFTLLGHSMGGDLKP